MTLRLEAFFEDQIKTILSSYKAQGKSNPSKTNLRSQKGKFPSASHKMSSGRSCTSQTGSTIRKASPAISSGGSGVLQKRLPTAASHSPAAAVTRRGTCNRMSSPRTKRMCG